MVKQFMNGYFAGREGGGEFCDLYKPKDLRHLNDNVTLCLVAEAPFANWKRDNEQDQKHAREAFAAASPNNAKAVKTFVRIEGGKPVTYYGESASQHIKEQMHQRQIPQPPTRPRTALNQSDSVASAKVSKSKEPLGEIPLFGAGGPKRVCRTYHATDPGWGNDPNLDIVYNDAKAKHTPTKEEFIRVSKCSIPNPSEEAAADRIHRTHSARLPPVWKRPNYLHTWMMEEARKDAAVHKSIWRQQKERELQRQHAASNLNLHFERLKGAALSVSSPRYLAMEESRKAEANRQLAAAEAIVEAKQRGSSKQLQIREEWARQDANKPLSSNMRKELSAAFSRLAL